jgi:hypothetical protein
LIHSKSCPVWTLISSSLKWGCKDTLCIRGN